LAYEFEALFDQFLCVIDVFGDGGVVLVVVEADELCVDEGVFDASVSE
jgi:hypothetical protein